jgi:ComF family protein
MSLLFKKQINRFGNQAVDFLLPPLCPATGEMVDQIGMVDSRYWQQLNFIHAPFCHRCGTPFAFEATDMTCGACLDHPPSYDQARSALVYDDGCRSLILRFKHGDQTHAVKAFIPWLKMTGATMLEQTDVLLPVPLHRYRLIKRRFNQAELITRELSKYYPDGLLRVKATPSQGFKKAKDRAANVRKAFIANSSYNFEGKTVTIIDDVYTTGATLNECAKTLYRTGAKHVNCLTLAKAVKI